MQPFKTEYRYPVITSLVVFLVTAAISIGAAYFMYRARVEGTTREVFIAGWFTFWFGIFALLARSDLRARLQPANWLVRTQTNGILVKFRSYRNYHFDSTDPIVVFFDYGDVEFGGSQRVRQDMPGPPDGDTMRFKQFAVLKMRHDALVKELETQLAAERGRAAPHEGRWIRSQTKSPHCPVHTSPDGLVQIEWYVRPKLTRFLEEMSAEVPVKEATRTRQDLRNLKNASREDQEKALLELVATGDRIGAIKIIRLLYGYDLKHAVAFLDELSSTSRRV